MRFRAITDELLDRVNSKAQECIQKGKQRATVAVIVQHAETGLFLIIFGRENFSGNSLTNPGTVKGAVEKSEYILRAGAREILEEVGITESQIRFQTYGGSCSVTSLKGRKRNNGTSKKLYFIFHALYDGPLELKIDPREVLGYKWITLKEVKRSLRSLKSTRPDKYNALIRAFTALKKEKTHSNVMVLSQVAGV